MNKEKIEKLCNSVTSFFEKARKPALVLPNYLLLCSLFYRPGTSAMNIMGKTIADFGRLGIPTGPNTDGSPNLILPAFAAYTNNVNEERAKNEKIQVLMEPNEFFPQGLSLFGQPICHWMN